MGEILGPGPAAGKALDYALTGLISGLRPGRARYTMICAADGGVLDDLVVYRQGEEEFLVIANASNAAVAVDALRSPAFRLDAVVAHATGDSPLISVHGTAPDRVPG